MITAAVTAVVVMILAVPPCMSSRIKPALVRQHGGSTQGSTRRQRASTGAQGGRSGRTELKEAAVHPVGRPTSLEATTARIDGRLRAQAKAATTAPSPIPPAEPWLNRPREGTSHSQ